VIEQNGNQAEADTSKYRASNYQDVSNMIEETQQSLDSTCDIPRMVSYKFEKLCFDQLLISHTVIQKIV
jgi:hypothetical protein